MHVWKNKIWKVLDKMTKIKWKSRKNFYLALFLCFKVSGSKYYYLPEGKITKVNFIRKRRRNKHSCIIEGKSLKIKWIEKLNVGNNIEAMQQFMKEKIRIKVAVYKVE